MRIATLRTSTPEHGSASQDARDALRFIGSRARSRPRRDSPPCKQRAAKRLAGHAALEWSRGAGERSNNHRPAGTRRLLRSDLLGDDQPETVARQYQTEAAWLAELRSARDPARECSRPSTLPLVGEGPRWLMRPGLHAGNGPAGDRRGRSPPLLLCRPGSHGAGASALRLADASRESIPLRDQPLGRRQSSRGSPGNAAPVASSA
jgi:hypothetical protein